MVTSDNANMHLSVDLLNYSSLIRPSLTEIHCCLLLCAVDCLQFWAFPGTECSFYVNRD